MNEDEFKDLFNQAQEVEATNQDEENMSDEDLLAYLEDTLSDVEDLLNGTSRNKVADDDELDDDVIPIEDEPEDIVVEAVAPEPEPSPVETNSNTGDNLADDLFSSFDMDGDEIPIGNPTVPAPNNNTVDAPTFSEPSQPAAGGDVSDMLSDLGLDDMAAPSAPVDLGDDLDLDMDLDDIDQIEQRIVAKSRDGALSTESAENIRQLERQKQGVKGSSKKVHSFDSKKLMIALIALIILVPIVGFGIGTLMMPEQEIIELDPWDTQGYIHVEQASLGANNANFTFISEERRNGDSRFILSRMLIDYTSTVFFFDRQIDWTNYEVTLSDSSQKSYPILLEYRENDVTRDYLSFEPLDNNVSGIRLGITNKTTGDEVVFPIVFDTTMVRLPVFHMNSSKNTTFGHNEITIINGQFTSHLSQLYYYIDITEGNVMFDNVFLVQGATRLPMERNEIFEIDGQYIVGRLTFPAVPVVSGEVSVVFTDAFSVFDINERFSVSGLFRNTLDDRVIIPVDGNQIILERMGRRSEDFILVLHGVDMYDNRIETRLDSTLNVVQGNNEFNLPGNVFSGPIGADIRFAMDSRIGSNLNSVFLNVERAYMGGVDFSIDVSLDSTSSSPEFFSNQLISGAMDHLKNVEGFDQVEVIAFRPMDLNFTGIFRVANSNGDVFRYRVDSQRTDTSWDHVATRLN